MARALVVPLCEVASLTSHATARSCDSKSTCELPSHDAGHTIDSVGVVLVSVAEVEVAVGLDHAPAPGSFGKGAVEPRRAAPSAAEKVTRFLRAIESPSMTENVEARVAGGVEDAGDVEAYGVPPVGTRKGEGFLTAEAGLGKGASCCAEADMSPAGRGVGGGATGEAAGPLLFAEGGDGGPVVQLELEEGDHGFAAGFRAWGKGRKELGQRCKVDDYVAG